MTLPYVFAPAPQPEPEPRGGGDDGGSAPAADDAGSTPDAAAPADADAAAPTESETYAQRAVPRRPPTPRTVTGFTTGFPPTQLDVSWTELAVNSFPARSVPATGGLYVVLAGMQPIYVGEAQNFYVRWHKRLLEAYEVGLIGSAFPERPVTVWFGAMNPVPSEADRRVLESALIRAFINGGIGGPLRNSKQFNPFRPSTELRLTRACPPGINNLLRPSSLVGASANAVIEQLRRDNSLRVPAGTVFEIG